MRLRVEALLVQQRQVGPAQRALPEAELVVVRDEFDRLGLGVDDADELAREGFLDGRWRLTWLSSNGFVW